MAILLALKSLTLPLVLLLVVDCLGAILSVIYFPKGGFARKVKRVYSSIIAEIQAEILRLETGNWKLYWTLTGVIYGVHRDS